MQRFAMRVAVLASAVILVASAAPAPAQAVNPTGPICTVGGLISGVLGKVCTVATHAGRVLKATQKLLGGHAGSALKALNGASTATKALTAGAALASIVAWVSGGARLALRKTAGVISSTTRPQLQSTWFSATYWRMAGISALLTLPFLCAAAIQAVMRSDLPLLTRSVLGYLPLGVLAVSLAAPMTMLLLAASDELSGVISGASGDAAGRALGHASFVGAGVTGVTGSSLLLLVFGGLTVMATLALWMELLIRSAAVYVVVLMLPLFFAALVWPARRIWAVRAIELLVALILSKFVIVAVLSLGAAALGHTTVPGITADLAGATLVLLAAFSPWALLALLPLHELTGGIDSLRGRTRDALAPRLDNATEIAQAVVRQLPAGPSSEYGPPADEPARDDRSAAANETTRLDEQDSGPAETSDQPPASTAQPDPIQPDPAQPEPSQAEPTQAASSTQERRWPRQPGMEDHWQARDYSRPTLELTPEGLRDASVWEIERSSADPNLPDEPPRALGPEPTE